MQFLLAWRNIWRNPRRTFVILMAVIIGVWSMISLGALMRGMVVGMIDNGISTLTGDIQVHHRGYRDDLVVENSIPEPDEVTAVLDRVLTPEAKWAARVRVSAIANNARHAHGVTMVGIDPAREVGVSFIGRAVVEGEYLKPDDDYGILVGRALVEKFETRLGHKLVLMSQGTDKEIASRAFRVVGIFQADLQATEKQFVFITRPAAQDMLRMGQSISEISLVLPDHQEPDRVAADIKAALPPDEFEVHTWRELLPLLTAYIKIFDGFMAIWYVVVFIAMGFGIVNTTLMAVYERMREFGLLKALGMKPWWIVRGVLTETFYLLLLGMVIGNGLSLLCVFVLSGGLDLSALAAGAEFAGMSRIIYPVIITRDLALANLVVIILGLLVSLYPAVKAARFTPVQAMAQT